VLLITLGISYNGFSALIQNLVPQSGLLLAKAQFVNGFKLATLALALTNSAAIIPSALRGQKKPGSSTSSSLENRLPD